MTAVTNQKGSGVSYLDATDLTVAANAVSPMARLTAGEGAPGHLRIVEDIVSLPTTFFSATGNYARLARFPSNAKIKRVVLLSDAAIDAHTTNSAAAFTVSVGWSDATKDGTPTAFQGTVPKNDLSGTNVAIANAADNVFFGTVTAPAVSGKIPRTDITFNGAIPATYALDYAQEPLENYFGFETPTGNPNHNLGYFDLIIESSHDYTTVPNTAANVWVQVEYVV